METSTPSSPFKTAAMATLIALCFIAVIKLAWDQNLSASALINNAIEKAEASRAAS